MYGYGIQGKIHSWVKEFLSEREQRVTVNGSQSSWKHITSGIPQGSVLGPVLFLVFINDLPEAIEVLMKLFADDAKIYAVVSNDRENLVQTSLNRAVNWAKIWRMFFNTSKCHHLHVGKHDTGIRYTMTANNQERELEKVESEKDLGVIIDQNLTFRAHITSKVNKANKNLGIIFRTFTYIDQEMFLNLYKSIVRPHLEFLKETKELIKYPLKIIFQKLLHESELPPICKKANISAIFKKGEKKKPENYRPISLTSVPCKLMEKIYRDAIVEHMMENNLFLLCNMGL